MAASRKASWLPILAQTSAALLLWFALPALTKSRKPKR